VSAPTEVVPGQRLPGRVLVTGGSGYLGGALVDLLVARGSEVRVLDLVEDPGRPEGVELLLGDIRSEADVAAAVEGVDVVLHNVAQVPLAKDPGLFESVNVGGTDVLLRACEDAGVGKVVHTSSSAVFGVPTSNPVGRTTAPAPAEAYGRAKLDAELLCRAATSRGLDVSIVRPRTIVGPGRLGIFGILFDWIADGVSVPVIGSGLNRYQFVHAHDVATACLLAAARPGPATYNVGSEEFGTMRESLEALCDHAGTGARVVSVPRPLIRPLIQATGRLGLSPLGPYHWLMYGESMWFDVEPARQELGWSSQHSTVDAMCEAYDWFVQHRGARQTEAASVHRRSAPQGILRLAKHASRAAFHLSRERRSEGQTTQA
jgi:nucleoside-diphosphate-sugar epimerase